MQKVCKDLNQLTGWPEKVVKMQENWIGRSEGVLVQFKVENDPHQVLEVFFSSWKHYLELRLRAPIILFLKALFIMLNKNFLDDCRKMITTEEALSWRKKGLIQV